MEIADSILKSFGAVAQDYSADRSTIIECVTCKKLTKLSDEVMQLIGSDANSLALIVNHVAGCRNRIEGIERNNLGPKL
jgi:hypothetical protein